MRLGLIGFPVQHSLSPELYKEMLGTELEYYHLLPFEKPSLIPSLKELAVKYDGINITAPYKQHFNGELIIQSPIVKAINAVNTLSFTPEGVLGTNTDVMAVEEILENYKNIYPGIHIILIGSGVMARVTKLVCAKLSIKVSQISRTSHGDISKSDLTKLRDPLSQNIVINSCSRDFIFEGIISKEDIFWDYNYYFTPHVSSLPAKVLSYVDGQEMLKLQALAAVKFWKSTNPKLKC